MMIFGHQDRERGQTTAEYALLVGLCAISLIAAIVFLRDDVTSIFSRTGSTTGDVFKPPAAATCDPNYSGACLPVYPPDIDCVDLAAMGITNVTVSGSDPHNLDPDGDGIGCD
jgi:Flp pilus assembly pilin Flp